MTSVMHSLQATYDILLDRALEIGANDMIDVLPVPAAEAAA
jgi:hypothetical protein